MDLTHAVERVEAIRRKFGVESLAPRAADTVRSDLIAALARERRCFGSVKGEIRAALVELAALESAVS